MTEIDDAIEAAKDVLGGRGNGTYDEALDAISWLLVGISAFRQEVSDAAENMNTAMRTGAWQGVALDSLKRFIIPKPDPLVEAWNDMLRESKPDEDRLDVFRAALAKRGFQVTEIER